MNVRIFFLSIIGMIVQTVPAWAASVEEVLDPLVVDVVAGKSLTMEQKNSAKQGFEVYRDDLCEKSNPKNVFGLSVDDAASLYTAAVKLSLIDPERYRDWVAGYARIREVLEPIRRKLKQSDDPLLLASAILPAIWVDQADYAVQSYQKLAVKSPYLARFILTDVRRFWGDAANAVVKQAAQNSGRKIDDAGAKSKTPQEIEALLTAAATRVVAAGELTDEEKDDLHFLAHAYFKQVVARKSLPVGRDTREMDAAASYIVVVKVAIVNPERYRACVWHEEDRRAAFDPIRKQLETGSEDPFLMAAVIIPAIDSDEAEYAAWVFRKLTKRNPWLARFILDAVKGYIKETNSPFADEFLFMAAKSMSVSSAH